MKHKYLIWILFILMVFAQWYIPGRMITSNEKVLQNGKEFRFRVAPVDPYDAFRGRFVQLRFRDNVYKTTDATLEKQTKLYAVIENSPDNYARIKSLQKEIPLETGDYIETNIIGAFHHNDSVQMRLYFPFDRY